MQAPIAMPSLVHVVSSYPPNPSTRPTRSPIRWASTGGPTNPPRTSEPAFSMSEPLAASQPLTKSDRGFIKSDHRGLARAEGAGALVANKAGASPVGRREYFHRLLTAGEQFVKRGRVGRCVGGA
jgi:hypothetical protein